MNLLEKGEPGYEVSHIAFSDGILLICGESTEQISTSNESFCFLKVEGQFGKMKSSLHRKFILSALATYYV